MAQAHSPSPKRPADRREGALLHVGKHAESVGDADRRHHQRHEEDDAEKAPAADRLGAEERQAEPEQELYGHADDDIEKGGDEGAGEAIGKDGGADEKRQRDGERHRYDATDGAGSGDAAAGEPASERDQQRRGDDCKEDPRHRAEALEGAEEVVLLGAEEQLPEVQKTDEGQPETAWREGETRDRQIG